MMEILAVVLVAGIAIFASVRARRKGYSHNQRIVLSGIVAALLVYRLLAGDQPPGVTEIVFAGLAIVILAVSIIFVAKVEKQ